MGDEESMGAPCLRARLRHQRRFLRTVWAQNREMLSACILPARSDTNEFFQKNFRPAQALGLGVPIACWPGKEYTLSPSACGRVGARTEVHFPRLGDPYIERSRIWCRPCSCYNN